MNLNTILNHLNTFKFNAGIFSYNIDDRFERKAEQMLVSVKVPYSEIRNHIRHILHCQRANKNLSFSYFDKLSKREQIYYAAVDCLRGKAVKSWED